MNKFKRILTIIIVCFLTACATHKIDIKNDSYLFKGKNFTYAIYNEESQLINQPLIDLKNEITKRGRSNPITDIYIVSHGWNFTASEAFTNYHNYIELINKSQPQNPSFQPYVIFVSWISTTRPLTNFTSAVLPFGLDDAIKPVTSIIDNIPMHIMTAWKESMNATEIAIGSTYPNNYLNTNWRTTDYHVEVGIFDSSEKLGRDLPLSTLIYELMQKDSTIYKLRQGSIEKPKLHLVGHSYGAKLVALAGEEALRRWIITDPPNFALAKNQLIDITNPEKNALNKCKTNHWEHREEECAGDEKCETKHIDQAIKSCTAEFTGLSGTAYGSFFKKPLAIEPYFLWIKESISRLKRLDKIIDKIEKRPIESMVLFNPAMHPGEFSYPISGWDLAPSIQLKLIPRKAIVYSKTDYANGLLFNVKEMTMSTQVSQGYQSLINKYVSLDTWFLSLFKPIVLATNGGISLASSVGYGAWLYGQSVGLNLPLDLFHHITEHNFWGLDIKKASIPEKIPLYFLNTVDFFLPVFPAENGYPRNEDDYGFFRNSRTGLGKTGLNRLSTGRTCKYWFCPNKYLNYNLGALTEFDNEDKNSETFNILGDRLYNNDSALPDVGNKIYSFDASDIYNTWHTPVVGSHGDLRSYDKANKCSYLIRYANDLNERIEIENAIENDKKYKECSILFTRLGNTNHKWSITEFSYAKKLYPGKNIKSGSPLYLALEESPFDKKVLAKLLDNPPVAFDIDNYKLQTSKQKRVFTMNFLINFTQNNFIAILQQF